MSYDITLNIETGAGHVATVFDENFTSNCAPMFQLAIGGLPILHEMKACDAWHVLRAGLQHWENNRAQYEALNPANNWGDSVSAYQFLTRIMGACRNHPNTKIKVSY